MTTWVSAAGRTARHGPLPHLVTLYRGAFNAKGPGSLMRQDLGPKHGGRVSAAIA